MLQVIPSRALDLYLGCVDLGEHFFGLVLQLSGDRNLLLVFDSQGRFHGAHFAVE